MEGWGAGGAGFTPPSKGVIRTYAVILAIIVLLAFSNRLIGIYVDYLWFRHDAQSPEVFTKTLQTTVGLWLAGFLAALTIIFLSARRALSVMLVYLDSPRGIPAQLATSALDMVKKIAPKVALLVSFVLALGVGSRLSAAYREFWLFTNAVEFGKTDPVFNRDISFYTFQLPFLQVLAGAITTIFLLAGIFSLAIFLGVKALANLAGAELEQPKIRQQLSVLGGLFLISIGGQAFLARYTALYNQGPQSQFAGPGYTESFTMTVTLIMAILCGVVGLLSIANAKTGKPYRALVAGGAGLLVFAILGLGVIPSIIRGIYVEPNRLTVEAPFATRAIESTRFAYGIDRFQVRDFTVQPEPTSGELLAYRGTLRSMRLWDPQILSVAIDSQQALRPYYDLSDVDVDRYTLNGEQTVMMLAARNIRTEGLSDNARSWEAQRLRYTHGIGMVMTPVNRTAPNGQPAYVMQDVPPRSVDDLPIDQPRIYFSTFGLNTDAARGYIVVDTALDEFDFPAEPEANYRWTGERGVPVGGQLARTAFALAFSDLRLITNNAITRDSRLISRRDVRERASLIYPMLRFDQDPYKVLLDGRVHTFIDAYTTSNRVPYSQRMFYQGSPINYMRNSVKVVVDGYSGEMTAYAIEPDCPVLQTVNNIFPGKIRPIEEASQSIQNHFRYGEDMFQMQAEVLTRYHVSTPNVFLTEEDAWQIPVERGRADTGQQMIPYFVQMRLPEELDENFMLILPFTPRTRDNMIGWMAAHCDPERYGEVILYRFPRESTTRGPNQIEASMNQNAEVADIQRQFDNPQSRVRPGNLLVIPIGNSILYVKPLFLESRSPGVRPIPELRKVILSTQDRVVVADTYEAALARMFGRDVIERVFDEIPELEESAVLDGAAPADPGTTTEAPAVVTPPATIAVGDLDRAVQLLDQADEALRNGEWARYGELQAQAREILRRLAADN